MKMTIKDISPEELLALWKKGKSLWEAFSEFCDQKYIDEYNQINSEQKSDNKPPPQGILDALNQISQEWQKNTVNSLSREKAINNLINNLFKKIAQKKLMVIGYKVPINSDFPTLIPDYMLPPENIDINKSSISAHDISFVKIRIIKSNLLSKIKIKKQKVISENREVDFSLNKKVRKPSGRPSIRDKIKTAYEELEKLGKIDYSSDLKSHTEIIQKMVIKLNPEIQNNKGMDHEVIRLTVGKDFQSEKEKLKE